MHPILLIGAGAILLLWDSIQADRKASDAETLKARVQRLEAELAEAATGSVDETVLEELEAARRELAGLKAGAKAREAKPPAPAPKKQEEVEQKEAGKDNEAEDDETENEDA